MNQKVTSREEILSVSRDKDELGFSAIATFSRMTPTLHAL